MKFLIFSLAFLISYNAIAMNGTSQVITATVGQTIEIQTLVLQ